MSANRTPDRVFLFSGHMVDAPDRVTPRFPADKVPVARSAISSLLAQLAISERDLAICGGACGGDLLFAKLALDAQAPLEIYLPFAVHIFLKTSVDCAGPMWRSLFQKIQRLSTLHQLPKERPLLAAGKDPYEENNRWMLEAASRFGATRVELICLWDGKDGDGPGGTAHLMDEVQHRQGRTHWINTTSLWD